MAILGERSTVVVLREVFNGVRRFDDMQRHSGVPRQVLSNRLAMLVDEGILRRVPYRPEGGRERHEYRPTAKGLDLYPVLTALAEWGARYVADPEGPAVEMRHRDCGEPVHVALECGAGHRLDDPREVVPAPGPGAIAVR
ncbi:transcriptional regulator [Nocardioides sp. YIM 123512]|uniref:Transcriptional regulator n=2 Tax=Nocardioides flavescens TaxID=2691959 RepID=A0A6L7F0N4_9ACTN|nr:helix-turn-helix domain-containing protein [Nocardioides flavescens]MXG88394.1 transcriptional regulator [Nocardioides flavescens]